MPASRSNCCGCATPNRCWRTRTKNHLQPIRRRSTHYAKTAREDGRNVTRQSRPKDEAPAGQFEIGHQGRYAVFAVLEQGGHAVLLAQPPAEFDVAGFDCDLPIVVPLHAAALAAAREQLARDAGPR